MIYSISRIDFHFCAHRSFYTTQLLYLEVRDHDPVNPDDVIGDAYIKLDDFVAKGTYTQVLEKAKSGSVTITRTTPIYFDLVVK